MTEPGLHTINFLLNSHFPIGTKINGTPYNFGKKITREEIKGPEIDWTTPELIVTVFKLFRLKKPPGADGIEPIAFKHLPSNFIKYITIIYKTVKMLAYTPKIWKEARMIFIPKPGRDSYKIAKAWRLNYARRV